MSATNYRVESQAGVHILRLDSHDGTNRLARECVLELTAGVAALAARPTPLVITGSQRYFSVGADLSEISALDAVSALEFSKIGQALMSAVQDFPAPVYAAISGYCMGGGLDLALSCHCRVASPHAMFGHRGAALGLITGWGGTQRLPRLIGKGRALEMFVAAEKVNAQRALRIGLIDAIAENPVAEAIRILKT